MDEGAEWHGRDCYVGDTRELPVSGIALAEISRCCEIDGMGMMQARSEVKPRHMSLVQGSGQINKR